jgi:hypothetical protein
MVVIAVGSAVRRAVPSVDLDLVVLVKEVSLFNVKPPIEVDLRAYPIDQVDALIAGGTDLLGWSVKFGKVLLQKESAWDRILKQWQCGVPLPSTEVATRRAGDAFRRFTNVREVGDYEAAYEQAVSYLTHLARAELIKRSVYPASRPELPGQLRAIERDALAAGLERLIGRKIRNLEELAALVLSTKSH